MNISKNNKQICVIISNETNEKLEKLAQKECRSKSQLVNYIITKYINEYREVKFPEHLIDFLNPDYYKK